MDVQALAEAAYDAQDAPVEEKPVEEVTTPEDGQPVEDAEEETPEEKSDDDTNEEEVASDEDVAEQIDAAKTKVDELPPMNRYIYDGLPQITTKGIIDGKEVTLRVKTADELPENFEFAKKRDELLFNQSLIDQGSRAVDLRNQYNGEQNTRLNQQEANDIQSDLAELQEEGLIPKFSALTAQNNPDNPAVQTADAVLKLYYKVNQDYAAKGRSYRISYRDAFDKYELQQSRLERTETKDTATSERKKVAAKVGSGGTGASKNKLQVTKGMTVDDILREHEDDFS